jgi:hypothetical protein
MRHIQWLALAAWCFTGGCSSDAEPNASEAAGAPVQEVRTAPDQQPQRPVSPPAPGTPGGLPDDRTPLSEAPFTPESAQGAANAVQTYYALIGERQYGEARRLWAAEGAASGMDAAAFAKTFERFSEYRAQIGAPGGIEGAGGSLFVEVPVVLYGRLKTGAAFSSRGTAVLRRVNNVPGATAAQLRWHIASIDGDPAFPKE